MTRSKAQNNNNQSNAKALRDVFKGHTVFVLASGPSLTEEDAYLANENGKTIVVNTTVKMLPDADVLFAADFNWWERYKSLWRGFKGYKVTKNANRTNRKIDNTVYSMPYKQKGGLSKDHLIFGSNSGQAAISLAYLMGASRIVLLGFDLSLKHGVHWHGKHEKGSNPHDKSVARWKGNIESMYKQSSTNVEIINASRYSELEIFPRLKLEEIIK